MSARDVADLRPCPFCGDTDFDAVGLKMHLGGECEAFNETPGPAVTVTRRAAPAPIATPADDAVARAREAFDRAAMEFAAILDHRDRIYGSLDGPVFVKAYRERLAAERAAKGGERPRCACGCVDKLHDAGQPGTRRCNQPGCGCEDFISASRDGGAAKGGDRG